MLLLETKRRVCELIRSSFALSGNLSVKNDFSLTRKKPRQEKRLHRIFSSPVQFNIGQTIDGGFATRTRCMRLYARGRPASSEIFHFLGSRNIVNRPCERPTRLFIIIFCFFSLPSPPPFGFYKNRARINRGAKVSAISHHSRPR